MRFALLVLATLAFNQAWAGNNKESLYFLSTKQQIPTCQAGHEASLAGGAVTILPGDVICISIRIEEGLVVPVGIVDKNDDGNAVVIRLWREPGHGVTFLSVHNPLSKFLTYKAYIKRANSADREYTSTCPVLGRLDAYEQWPYQVNEITLSDFALIPESKTIECL